MIVKAGADVTGEFPDEVSLGSGLMKAKKMIDRELCQKSTIEQENNNE